MAAISGGEKRELPICLENDYFNREEACTKGKSTYEGSELQFYVNSAKNNESILEYYFNDINDLSEGIIYEWLSAGNWEQFIRYGAQLIKSGENLKHFSYLKFYHLIEKYRMAYLKRQDPYRDDFRDQYGRSYCIFDSQTIKDFLRALVKISALNINGILYHDLYIYIRDFMLKAEGNLDILRDEGFDDQIEYISPEQQLLDYIHRFLQSGQSYCEYDDEEFCAIRYDLGICSRHKGPVRFVIPGTMEGCQEEKRRYEYEKQEKYGMYYRLATNDEAAEFYFSYGDKGDRCKCWIEITEMILSCIYNNDFERADYLAKMLLRTIPTVHANVTAGYRKDLMRFLNNIISNLSPFMNKPQEDVTFHQIKAAAGIVEMYLPILTKTQRETVQNSIREMLAAYPEP